MCGIFAVVGNEHSDDYDTKREKFIYVRKIVIIRITLVLIRDL